MTTPRIPKRIAPARSCYYQLPTDLTALELNGYELEFWRQYAGIFHSRSGSTFFFELPTTTARNAFLKALEISAHQAGILTYRGNLPIA